MSEIEQIAKAFHDASRKAHPERPAWNRLNKHDMHHMRMKHDAFREAKKIIDLRRRRR